MNAANAKFPSWRMGTNRMSANCRHWLGVAAVLTAVGLAVDIATVRLIESRPEFVEVPKILLSNTSFANHFGEPVSAVYQRRGSRMSVYTSGDRKGETEGVYRFSCAGSRTNGVVDVSWKSDPSSRVRITSIDFPASLTGDGKTLYKASH